jgi:hypothetical protein
MTGELRAPMPQDLRYRAVQTGPPPEQRVRYRPVSWERALSFVPEACALLRDVGLTEGVPGSDDVRTVTRASVQDHLTALELGDAAAVLSAFVLAMAWSAGTGNTRALRHAPLTLADPYSAADQLTRSVEAMRADDLTAAFAFARLPGIGLSTATKWFALAGHRIDRRWQPLILDLRVRSALEGLGVRLTVPPGTRRTRANIYGVYLRTLHGWTDELVVDNSACRAETVEWLLSQHGRDGWKDA